ncbi:hypothetical protein D9613_007530 [Agrocybe pediades]|uniref:DUF6534 domain-containing protein n=1 Tax=Agrocybe pediades TaxID=84607 RepID=A0A8H4QP54_9AGAR|nr:hypothetical protein D9613_007530 [Agrocybe pediades]
MSASPTDLPPIPPDMARIAGPLVLGYFLHWGLFGALSVQIGIYHLAFPKDATWLKVLVYTVYAAETAQTIMLTAQGFQTFASGFGDIRAILRVYLLWFSIPILGSSVTLVAQVFYGYRIMVLSKSKILAGVIYSLAIVQWAGGIATGVIARQKPDLSDFLFRDTYITLGFLNGGAALCDVIIAASMTYYLSKGSRASQWKATQRVLSKLIRLVIETGTITAAIAIINLIVSVLPGKPTYYQTCSAVLGKLYSNTMMAVINSRITFGSNHISLYESEEPRSTSTGVSYQTPRPLPPSAIIVMRNVSDDYDIPLQTWQTSVSTPMSPIGPFNGKLIVI